MNILSRVVNILCTLNEGYWLYRIVDTIYDRREGVLRLRDRRGLLWGLIAAYTLIVLGLNSIVLTSAYTTVIMMVQSALCIWLFWKCDVWNSIAVMGGYFLALLLEGGTIISLTGMIGGDRLIQITTAGQGRVRAVYLMFGGALWYGVNFLFHKWLKKQAFGEFSIRHTVYLLFFGLGGCLFLCNQMLTSIDMKMNFIWYMFVAIVFMAIFFAFHIVKERWMQEQIRQMNTRNEVLERNYERLSNYYKMNAKLYHDMNHHLDAIYYMAVGGHAEQVCRYIENIKEPIDSLSVKPRTGIDVVDVVFYEAEKRSQEKGISMMIDAHIFTKDISVQKQDLCALLSNLLDNAVEAAGREVRVLVKMVNGQLLIQVQNDCLKKPVEKEGRFVTSKADKSRHGFGIQNIKYVVTKYNGTADFKVQDGKFCADIMIMG